MDPTPESSAKSTPDEIRARFDADVERFSDLGKGQEAAMDAALGMDLIAQAAARATPHARSVLDVGCGAGNYTLKLLQYRPGLRATLLDLSRPMLDRAQARVRAAGAPDVVTIQSDVRAANLGAASFDVILAAAVLHHLRTEAEWLDVFTQLFRALTPAGSIWIYDMVDHELPEVHAQQWGRYGQYLTTRGGEEYRQRVFAYVAKEDTPRSLTFQLDLLRRVGFSRVDVLHKNGPFAAFGAKKGG